jgi:chorismate mutase/prephenate dehydratase
MTNVSFQGERGAYSESAIYSFFGSSVQVVPCRGISDVFESVKKETTDYGVIPIENSIEGSVNQSYDLFLEYDLQVCGEIVLRIRHCLITNPTTDLDSIEMIYSHPQALAQCRNYLEKLGREVMATYDTAGSVKMMKEKRLFNAAAIAGERAAEIYGMKILVKGIEDNPSNYTRFFVLSKLDSPPSENDKTSIIFTTKHIPGALYHVLEEFAVRKINLRKIESRPTKQKPWEYNFYLDFEGHRNEKRCNEALKAVEKKSSFLKVLGSYPKAKENI